MNHYWKGIIGCKKLRLPAVFFDNEFFEKASYYSALNGIIVHESVISTLGKDLFIPIDILHGGPMSIQVDILFKLLPSLFFLNDVEELNGKKEEKRREKKVEKLEDVELEHKAFEEFRKRNWKDVEKLLVCVLELYEKVDIKQKNKEMNQNYKLM